MSTPFARLENEIVDHRFKGLPPDAEGRTVGALAAERRCLYTGGFTTPVLTLSAEAVAHNLSSMERFAARHGLVLAPHGKTSMAPQLFRRQLDHGAWGITVAVPHQARVARAFGVPRIFLANELVDPAALAWLAGEQDADPGFRCVVYVDSERGVELMDAALRDAGARRPLDVVVELGVPGGRSGVRDARAAADVAAVAARTATLRLVGVAGYEGEVPGGDAESVRAWLDGLCELAVELDKAGRFSAADEIIVSAGGSAWFDEVAAAFTELPELSRPVCAMLRSGAYISHDDGRYRDITPFNRVPHEGSLLPAFRLWAQVVSRPEPSLALVNAGKRDIAYDLDLPEVQAVRTPEGVVRGGHGLTVAKVADQHAFVVGTGEVPRVGDWVGLGMSHPCTIFDKWPLIPLVAGDGTVTDYIRTFF
ncbi:alanine racemase [Streptomyces radicis]|uniref:Amino acid deaminase n=1 Tax=Streptomyces radicis TaxID=1750517 RepID=A0A3A9W5B8_9ACTN|nr:alanine racemase [Streptomyces radicis]RKN07623.1 amino acid deaminase [Streptomyces radicis]RKN18346.1 amino acid deaminase [Streptomyces radicis]